MNSNLQSDTLDGWLFARMAEGAAAQMRANAERVNRLNVFPVPDGDTGDNMRMTIESGVTALEGSPSQDLAEVMNVLSRGMLFGARGNSGVILSQFFAGMAKSLTGYAQADAYILAKALSGGVRQAYASVMTPTEGTILTVAREAVEYASSRLNDESTIRSLFGDLVKEMYASLQRTPEILDVLGQAGVIDSGGAGLFCIMDGFNRVLGGETIPEESERKEPAAVPEYTADAAVFGPDSEMTYGYCTEVLLQLQNRKTDVERFDLDALKTYLSGVGDSIVAFRDGSIVKIHVHTKVPDEVLGYCRRYGEFRTVKIENMSLQHSRTIRESEKAAESAEKDTGIVAVCSGEGLAELFRAFGADAIVEGGQTNNPSPQELIEAFRTVRARRILVFPNNGNIRMAADQAAALYREAEVVVLPTRDPGAGYAVLSVLEPDAPTEDLLAQAEETAARIRTACLSSAVRNVELDGVRVSVGDYIGFSGKRMLVAREDRLEAAEALFGILAEEGVGGKPVSMLTVFCGRDVEEKEREMLEMRLAEGYPATEIYFLDGGQEVYPYLFTVE